MNEVLKLLRLDLGIKSNARDDYFRKLLEACKNELKSQKGIKLDLELSDDMILLSDFAAWRYRKRETGEPLPENLRYRINSRNLHERSKGNA